MGEDLSQSIIKYREGNDGELFTEDDGIFDADEGITIELKEGLRLTTRDQQKIASLASKALIGVKSDNYKITADVYSHNKLFNRYTVIIGKDEKENKYHVLEWHH